MNKINQDLCRFLLGLAQDLDSQEIQNIYHAYKGGDHEFIVNEVWSPKTEEKLISHREFAIKYLSANLLRKSTVLNLGLDTSEEARRSFLNVEKHNRDTNARGCGWREPATTGDMGSTVDLYRTGPALIGRARYWVARILGPLDIDHAVSLSEFSQGASDDLPRREASSAAKYLGRPTTTLALKSFATSVVRSSHIWEEAILANGELSITMGDRFRTVPKNAQTDRTMCLQPRMNLYLQKGCGKLIKRRLARFYASFGIIRDLNTSFLVNKELAKAASIKDNLTTVDGREASNRWTTFWVEYLLGESDGWYEYLNTLRCHYTDISREGDGSEWHRNQMFMAMGNGFTFELQTVLFLALGLAAVEVETPIDRDVLQDIICFGDDLIIPTYAYAGLKNLYTYVGHEINDKKTFSHGPFRESCGGHYYGGYDVEPFQINDSFDPEKPGSWTQLFNELVLWQNRVGHFTSVPLPRSLSAILRVLKRMKSIAVVPYGYPIDSGIYANKMCAFALNKLTMLYGTYRFRGYACSRTIAYFDAKSQIENGVVRLHNSKRERYDYYAIIPEFGGYLDWLNQPSATFDIWDRGTSRRTRTVRTLKSSRWTDFPPSRYQPMFLIGLERFFR